jgi:hypothetical protein
LGDCGATVTGEAAAGAEGTEEDEEEKRARGRAARARTCLLSIVVVNLDVGRRAGTCGRLRGCT